LTPIRLFRPQGTHRVAMVSVEPSYTFPDRVMVHVAQGATRATLAETALYGPMTPEEARERVTLEVQQLRTEGFGASGLQAIDELKSPKARVRALAAVRLGWRREALAVEPLLALTERPGEEQSSVIDALGMIGDVRAVPVARTEAQRKLLSRRRSGVEALRALGDGQGLAEAASRAMDRLPEGVRAALLSEGTEEVVAQKVGEALKATPLKDRGLALDTLYEVGRPAGMRAVVHTLGASDLGDPFVWRYAKSVFKRSLLRFDLATFGVLAHQMDVESREGTGTRADLKSGYDGQVKSTLVFGRRTRQYVRRRSWRWLRRLAAWRPDVYAAAAAEAIVHYTVEDEELPSGRFGAYASCYLLHRVLWGRSSRYRFLSGSLRARREPNAPAAAPEGVREESFPDLWDRSPAAYLRLLGGSRLVVVQQFAFAAITSRYRAVLETATTEQVLALLDAPYEPTVQLAIDELRRRFDPARPDWTLLAALLADARAAVAALGLSWLEPTSAQWARDPEVLALLLGSVRPEASDTVARLAVQSLADAPATTRRAVAGRLFASLLEGEPQEGAHQALANVLLPAMLPELVALGLSFERLSAAIDTGSNALRAVAAAVVVRRPGALDELGILRVVAMAKHEAQSVRDAAFQLLEQNVQRFAVDPWPLLAIAESPWTDGRRRAVALVRQLDLTHLPLEAIFEIVDSSREELQGLGRDVLMQTKDRWEPAQVVPRLLEHPQPGMRPFTLSLAEAYVLGKVAREAAAPAFFRAVLLDLQPRRVVKQQAIRLLVASGLRGIDEAREAARVLGAMLDTKTQHDFEDAMEGLAHLHLAFPELSSQLVIKADSGR
jgi:hypothetical protein